MKRSLEVDQDDDVDSGSGGESETETESINDKSGHDGGSKQGSSGRTSKSKERNRMHSKLTRLRRVSRINQMKERLMELQTETTRLEQLFDELNTANILLCLRVNMPPNTIDEINSLGEAFEVQGKTFDTRENIMDQLKERVRAEAEILREKFHSSQIRSTSLHSTSADAYEYGDSESAAVNGKELEKKERNRIHAKLTRVRRKLLTNEVQEAIQHLEAKNLMMHNKLDALIRQNLDNLNILVVDDVLSIRKTTKKMLENSGFNVVISKDGAEAVKMMNESQFDVVLMDLQMPVMDGIEAMKVIRTRERQQNQLQEDMLASASNASSEGVPRSPSAIAQESSSSSSSATAAAAAVSEESSSVKEANDAENSEDLATKAKSEFSSAALSASGPKKQTFIIALSAFSDEVTLAETYQAGADAFIAKPFNLGQFKETLQSLMTMAT